MITGELKSKIDRIWDTMWSGGISNPLSVIEQLTYLLFIKRLDELQTIKEARAHRTNRPVEEPIFPDGPNPATKSGFPAQQLRWSRFKQKAAEEMFHIVRDEVFPFIKALGSPAPAPAAPKPGEAPAAPTAAKPTPPPAAEQPGPAAVKAAAAAEGDSTYAHHMKDALFMMPTPRVLSNVVDQLDAIDMADKDTKGDLYEYMLGKIASAGQNGQFRTPRHIIKLMVDMMRPRPTDVLCDPACGTAGFLVAASEYLLAHHSGDLFKTEASRKKFNSGTFHGYDFDPTMLRIGSMNMLLHGVENPDIRYRDSLAQPKEGGSLEEGKYTLILANPPFAGSLDYESTAKDLLQTVKTKKTELLFLALFLRLLSNGGRAAVIVPDGVLFGSSTAHKALRKKLVEEQKLDAIVSMPSGVFKPYAGVSTAILLFTKTNSGGTDHVWFYDLHADGFSLDDKRTPQPDKSDLPDLLARWRSLTPSPGTPGGQSAAAGGGEGLPLSPEHQRQRTDQSFLVPKADIAANDYDLSINRYKEVTYAAVEHDAPRVILDRLAKLEDEIAKGRAALEGMLK